MQSQGGYQGSLGTSYELGTAFMGEGTESLVTHPRILEPASLRANLCVCGARDEMLFHPAELHPGPKPATLEGALLHPQASVLNSPNAATL